MVRKAVVYLAISMTPQATRAPELPSGCVVESSGRAVMITPPRESIVPVRLRIGILVSVPLISTICG